MKKVKIKIPAKINLTLDVTGENNGYHNLDSLFISVNLYDTVTAKKRKDDKIRLFFCGVPAGITPEKSNAYRAALAVKEKYGTAGADIKIKRKIPAGGGLGGSSADAAGVIKALFKLYELAGGEKEIADKTGSDVAFMLNGGFARVCGRGAEFKNLELKDKLYFLIVTGLSGVSSKECYKKYDEHGVKYPPCTERALLALSDGRFSDLGKIIKNDLYQAAKEMSLEIEENLAALKKFGAAAMTGSGSSVFAAFDDVKKRDFAYKVLKRKFGARLIKAESAE